MAEKQDRIVNESPGKYFHVMLNMADDDLNPYQYRLLGHYVRVGNCWQGVRTTAKITRMSAGMVVKTRRELQQMGWINVVPGDDIETCKVTVIDRMAANVERYQKQKSDDIGNNVDTCSPGEQGGVHGMNGGVHQVNERITPEEKPPIAKQSFAEVEQSQTPDTSLFHSVSDSNQTLPETLSMFGEDVSLKESGVSKKNRSAAAKDKTQSEATGEKKVYPRDLVFDAISSDLLGIPLSSPIGEKEKGYIRAIKKELKTIDNAITGKDITGFVSWYKSAHPGWSLPRVVETIAKYFRDFKATGVTNPSRPDLVPHPDRPGILITRGQLRGIIENQEWMAKNGHR